MRNNLLPYLIGIIVGIIIGFIIFSAASSGNRYSIIASQDGTIVHRIDSRSGKVWIKSGITDTDAEGNPVTVYYWEELVPDGHEAAASAEEAMERVMKEKEAALEEKREADIAEFEIKQRRINDISALCGEDMLCVQEKCSTGYQGAPDPEWTTYCAETIFTNLAKLVIEKCEGADECIKDYCREKHNNTYPAVSDCVQEINLIKIESEVE